MLKGVWGTSGLRLGADSMKDFDACTLCLHPAVEPLICPKGHLFCKGCIYASLMAQKNHKKKQLEKYNAQLEEAKSEATKDEKEAKVKELTDFERLEGGVLPADAQLGPKIEIAKELIPAGYEAHQTAEGKVYVINRDLVKAHSASTEQLTKDQREARKKYMPCFWIPNLTPDAGPKKMLSAPTSTTCCPEGQHTLRLKQLRPVILTAVGDLSQAEGASSSSSSSSSSERKRGPAAAPAKRAIIAGSASSALIASGTTVESTKVSARWMCPSCRNGLTNSTKVACLRTCGHLLCIKCVQQFVAKDGQCVHCGSECRKKDVIELTRGGTGFAATGAVVAQSLLTPAPHV